MDIKSEKINLEKVNKLIEMFAEEFLQIVKDNHQLKYNETISVFWVIFRIMNHLNDPKIIFVTPRPYFTELCELLKDSIIGDNYNNNLSLLIEKLEIQIDLPETVLEFYDKLSSLYKSEMVIHPDEVMTILKKCVRSAGTRRKISRKR
jgi:hypothetical protein